MRDQIIKQLEYDLEKEKHDFLGKYFFNETTYNDEELKDLMSDIKAMVNRLDVNLYEANKKYKLLDLDEMVHLDCFEYLYENRGLWVYNQYFHIIKEIKERIKIVKGYANEEQYGPNEYAQDIILTVKAAFELSEVLVREYTVVDEAFAVSELMDDFNTLSLGAVFHGDNKEELLDKFVSKLDSNEIYEVELNEETFNENLEALQYFQTLQNTDIKKTIIIIKNINIALIDSKLREAVLILLNKLYRDEKFILLFTIDIIYEFAVIRELSEAKFSISDEGCFYNF